MTDEGADVAARYGEADHGVDQVCKEGNSILPRVSGYVNIEVRLQNERHTETK